MGRPGHKFILIALLIISIVLVLWLYFFEQYYVTVWFDLNPTNVNKLIENLSLAYIASYMFYYIVVVIKEKEDRRIILPLVADYTYVMLNNIVIFTSSFREWGNLEKIKYITSIHDRNISIYPTDDEINQACAVINPDEAKREAKPMGRFIQIPHFLGLMIKFSLDVDYCLDILLAKSNHLDLRLLKILTSIKISRYHNEMISYKKEEVLTSKLNVKTLHSFERGFKEYYALIRELEQYANRHLKAYVERPALKERQPLI